MLSVAACSSRLGCQVKLTMALEGMRITVPEVCIQSLPPSVFLPQCLTISLPRAMYSLSASLSVSLYPSLELCIYSLPSQCLAIYLPRAMYSLSAFLNVSLCTSLEVSSVCWRPLHGPSPFVFLGISGLRLRISFNAYLSTQQLHSAHSAVDQSMTALARVRH